MMMGLCSQVPYLEFFVEEPSMKNALDNLLPKIFSPTEACWNIRVFNGKSDLLRKLPLRLRGRRNAIQPYHKIVVIVDRDRDDCHELKQRMEVIAQRERLITKSSASGGIYHVLNRIAIEELEAWFFGDPAAIMHAYPKISASALSKAAYRNPDEICGGTWEALERILQKAGYYSTGIVKLEVANKISAFMNVNNNHSTSFNLFVYGLRDAVRNGAGSIENR